MAKRSGRVPRTERVRLDRTPVGITIGLGVIGVVAAVEVAAMLPASAGLWRLAPPAAALAVLGAGTADPVAVAAVAGLCCLVVNGFLVNRFGVLTWHGTPDMYRLLVVAVSAGAGLLVGAVRQWRRRPRPLIVPPEWTVAVAADSRALSWMNKEEVPGG